MDFKQTGNAIFLVGETGAHLGGSHLSEVLDLNGGRVPSVDPAKARHTFEALHRAIQASLVRSCHDLSEGGLMVALAEMAFAGDLGATVDIGRIPLVASSVDSTAANVVRLFSESNSRFLVEIDPKFEDQFVATLDSVAVVRLGEVTDSGMVVARNGKLELVHASIEQLKRAWQSPLDWS